MLVASLFQQVQVFLLLLPFSGQNGRSFNKHWLFNVDRSGLLKCLSVCDGEGRQERLFGFSPKCIMFIIGQLLSWQW